jgi:hypothetical protein
MKTTLGVYAHANNNAVLQARENVHSVWLKSAGLLEEKDNVKPLKRAK